MCAYPAPCYVRTCCLVRQPVDAATRSFIGFFVTQIYPDPVGYGFIVRGTGPCFVKIVDPDSPAFKAGLRVRQFSRIT